MTRPTYAWTVEDQVHAGTLVDYAHDHKLGSLADVEVGPYLWVPGHNHEVVRLIPEFTSTGYNDDDYATVTITVGDDEASYSIDGRS